MSRNACRPLLMQILLLVGVPSMVYAQGSIGGVVEDASGAVLPGVTVEAASQALIEKVRSVVTDGTGQYKIVDLRPGTYTITFTLTGFSAVKREGIELTGSFAATVNAALKVGSVTETVTVTGEAPTVDVQSVTQQRVLANDLLDAIPTGRTQYTATTLVPGVSGTRDVGGANSLALTTMSIHGGQTTDSRILIDGFTTEYSGQNGSLSNHMADMGNTQEITVDYAAVTAEQAYAGLRINLIPREGGNTYTGSFFGTYVNDKFQGSNFTPDLMNRGLTVPNGVESNHDYDTSAGGPIMRDKLWFFASTREVANNNYVGGRFYNLNAGNPSAWTYLPDPTRQETDNLSQWTVNGRATWQVTPRNKISLYSDYQNRCWCNYSSTGLYSPEAMSRLDWPENHINTAAWSSPVTSRLLLEGRFAKRDETYNYPPTQPDGSPNFNLIQVTDQATGIIYRSMGVPGSPGTWSFQESAEKIWQASLAASYVTGAHALKVGFQDVWIQRHSTLSDNNFNLAYRFNNGVPNQIIEHATPWNHDEDQKAELGVYAQDKWTLKRLTLNLGVRFDYFNSYYPAQSLGPGPLVPTRNLTFPQTPGLDFKDITPRMGVVYDLFGTGKTALKVSAGKYESAVGVASGGVFGEADNPIVRLANQVTRSWTPTGTPATNPNYYIPQCNLINPVANGNCGTMSDVNFGQATQSTTYDPQITGGWRNRPYQWEFSTGVQQQLMPRMSVNAGYFRRIYGNFLVTDNLSVAPSNYSPFSITAPLNAGLPGGGGDAISGLYDLNPNKVGQVNNLITFASNYGNEIQHWNGLDVTLDARPRQGMVLQGGLSTGRTSTDICDVVTKVNNPSPLYCHVDTTFLTQVKLLGAYTLPKVEAQVSATFQSIYGPAITANYNAPNALVAPSLGRNLSGGAANTTVNLIAPGAEYGDRSNELDVRVAKALKLRRSRLTLNFDLYNMLNANPVLTENSNYAAFRVPLSILQPRLFKFSAQFNF